MNIEVLRKLHFVYDVINRVEVGVLSMRKLLCVKLVGGGYNGIQVERFIIKQRIRPATLSVHFIHTLFKEQAFF